MSSTYRNSKFRLDASQIANRSHTLARDPEQIPRATFPDDERQPESLPTNGNGLIASPAARMTSSESEVAVGEQARKQS